MVTTRVLTRVVCDNVLVSSAEVTAAASVDVMDGVVAVVVVGLGFEVVGDEVVEG
jgi:hypothetical protein